MQPADAALADYFRCPGGSLRLEPETALSAAEGFFRFRGTVCYGRCAGAVPSTRADGQLPDVSDAVTTDPAAVRLPFDLAEVVENLRSERYSNGQNHGHLTGGSASRRLYYLLRPMLGVTVRKHLQRIRLAGWDKITFPHWPLDTSVDRLFRAALAALLKSRRLERIPFIWFWPDGAPACAILTHDVEAVAGRDFCERLMDIDDSAGLKSSFQLVPEVRYRLDDAFLESFRRRGFEINVHDLNHDGALFQNQEEFLRRAEQINRYATSFQSAGFRAGAMYRDQRWFGAFTFSYDMSVPNVAHLEPQRGGCCTVMPYFVGNIVELPLTTIQDYSLFQILNQYSMDVWTDQIERILQENGLITLLTHPDYLIEAPAQAVYRQLLAHIARLRAERDVWTPLPRDAARWWRERRALVLREERGTWRIEGQGADRARVAFASLDGDRLVYTLDRPR